MVVVVVREHLRELEARVVVGAEHDAMHYAGGLEYREVAIGRADREARCGPDELGNGHRAVDLSQPLDERAAPRGVPLPGAPQARCHLRVHVDDQLVLAGHSQQH